MYTDPNTFDRVMRSNGGFHQQPRGISLGFTAEKTDRKHVISSKNKGFGTEMKATLEVQKKGENTGGAVSLIGR